MEEKVKDTSWMNLIILMFLFLKKDKTIEINEKTKVLIDELIDEYKKEYSEEDLMSNEPIRNN